VGKTGSFFATGKFAIELAMAVPSNKEDWEAFGATQPIPKPTAVHSDEDEEFMDFGLFD